MTTKMNTLADDLNRITDRLNKIRASLKQSPPGQKPRIRLRVVYRPDPRDFGDIAAANLAKLPFRYGRK